MEIKTFQSTYDLAEFHCYITKTDDGDCINVVELLLNTDNTEDISYIEKDFSHIFVVESHHHSYVFSGYEVTEYYITDNSLIKVICVK